MKLNEIDWQQVKKNVDAFEQKANNPELELQSNTNHNINVNNDMWEYSIFNNIDNDITIYHISRYKYRIKPKPKYQPYKEVKEEWIGKKVIPLNENTSRINTITDIDLTMNEVAVYSHWKTMYNMFENYIWGNNGDENDGKPFGEIE